MSRATADTLARADASHLAEISPECKDLPAEDTGSAVLGILSSFAATCRVKERVAKFDQQGIMDLVDAEVNDARASRP